MPIDNPISQKEIDRNVRLQRYYPIGTVNAIFVLLEELWGKTTRSDEKQKISKTLDSLVKYDNLIRERYHSND